MISAPLTVASYLATQYRLDRPLAQSTAWQYYHSVEMFGRWLGHDPLLRELREDLVSRWLGELAADHAPVTVADHRRTLLVVWRHAAGRGLIDPPGDVCRVNTPRPIPIAWTLDEIRRLLAVCGSLSGSFGGGQPRREYCLALVNAAWDTGLRRSDLWKLERESIRDDGQIVMRQRKTGLPHFPRLRAETLKLVLGLPANPPLGCPYASVRWWYRFWDRHVIKPAGVRPGCLQQLRRSGATHLASEHPEAVQRYLGHASPAMQRWYVDLSLARPQQFLPPEIG